MYPRFLFFVLSLFLLSGCSYQHYIRPDSPNKVYRKMNRKLTGKKTTVNLQDGTDLQGKIIQVTPDTVRWNVYPAGDAVQATPVSDIYSIKVVNRTRGVWQGDCSLDL